MFHFGQWIKFDAQKLAIGWYLCFTDAFPSVSEILWVVYLAPSINGFNFHTYFFVYMYVNFSLPLSIFVCTYSLHIFYSSV